MSRSNPITLFQDRILEQNPDNTQEYRYRLIATDKPDEFLVKLAAPVIQHGTPINAAILNRIVEEVNLLMGTYDTIRRFQLNFIAATIEQETKNNANLTGVDANIVIETFRNLDDISLLEGAFDGMNQKVFLP